jgi:hypothetical protein
MRESGSGCFAAASCAGILPNRRNKRYVFGLILRSARQGHVSKDGAERIVIGAGRRDLAEALDAQLA